MSLASPDVLKSQYRPISVPLTLSDRLNTFTRLSEGQHLAMVVLMIQQAQINVSAGQSVFPGYILVNEEMCHHLLNCQIIPGGV